MTFVKRVLQATINLGEGQFGDDKGPDVTLSGLRMMASIVGTNGESQGELQLRIFGLPLAMMNQLTLTTIQTQQLRRNTILLAAGDEGGQLSVVYSGTIDACFAEFQSAPDVVFSIYARSMAYQSVKPVNARSYPGSTSTFEILIDMALEAGLLFENKGDDVVLANPYFPGTVWDQIKACCRAARLNYTVDRGVLSVWPRGDSRASDETSTLSAANGMVGYPTVSPGGISVLTRFNPALKVGTKVNVVSDITIAQGEWNTYKLSHSLESERPGGAWFSQIECARLIPS